MKNPSTNELEVTEYVDIQGGLGETPKKLKTKKCTIAYMGASLTTQKNGYRPFLHERICEFTGNGHEGMDASLPGLWSRWALYTLDEKVLKHEPDLCFYEYMSADLNAYEEYLTPVLESIVRKLISSGITVCFIHGYRDEKKETDEWIRKQYKKVAEHYSIPTIDEYSWIKDKFGSGTFKKEEILKDVVHTTDPGAEIVGEFIFQAFKHISEHGHGIKDLPENILGPLLNPKKYPVGREYLKDRDSYEEGEINDYRYLSIDSDNELRVILKGKLEGILVVAGPDSGIIEVRNDEKKKYLTVWDPYCHYSRVKGIPINELSEDCGSTLTIKLTEQDIDYSSCRRKLYNTEAIKKRLKIIALIADGQIKPLTENLV